MWGAISASGTAGGLVKIDVVVLGLDLFSKRTENDGLPPQSLDLNPIEQIWGELENKQIYCTFKGKHIAWVEEDMG